MRSPNRVIHIQTWGTNPNQFIPSDIVVITPLEFAVFMGELKLTAMLFLYGADPIHNRIFEHEGVVHFERVEDVDDPQWPIKGFEGLERLVDRNSAQMRSLLWMLKFLHDGSIDLADYYDFLLGCLDFLGPVLGFSETDLDSFIRTSMSVLRRKGIPDHLSQEITDNALRLHLREVLKKYATVRRSPRFMEEHAEVWVL